jgi:hypothetical protein
MPSFAGSSAIPSNPEPHEQVLEASLVRGGPATQEAAGVEVVRGRRDQAGHGHAEDPHDQQQPQSCDIHRHMKAHTGAPRATAAG